MTTPERTTASPGGDPDDSPADDDLFDQDEGWDRPRRTNRLTVVLVVALLVVAGFAGGVVTQKHHDAGLGATAAALRNRAGGAGGNRTSAAPAAPADPAAPANPAAPVVVGTVAAIGGSNVTVTDTAGAEVTVVVPPTATVTTTGLGGLTVGAPVSVTGSRSAAGTVIAATLTSRGTDG